jgi:hypothetical protein
VTAAPGNVLALKSGATSERQIRPVAARHKLREEGRSLEQVQAFLGHVSYATTDRFYSHLTSKDAPVPARRDPQRLDVHNCAFRRQQRRLSIPRLLSAL